MFGLFNNDPNKKLKKQYEKLMAEAMLLQRKGDIKGYAKKMAEAETVNKQIEANS